MNFLRKVQIRRISTKGAGGSFVKRFQLFYSDDGALWTPYKQGSKIKVIFREKSVFHWPLYLQVHNRVSSLRKFHRNFLCFIHRPWPFLSYQRQGGHICWREVVQGALPTTVYEKQVNQVLQRPNANTEGLRDFNSPRFLVFIWHLKAGVAGSDILFCNILWACIRNLKGLLAESRTYTVWTNAKRFVQNYTR